MYRHPNYIISRVYDVYPGGQEALVIVVRSSQKSEGKISVQNWDRIWVIGSKHQRTTHYNTTVTTARTPFLTIFIDLTIILLMVKTNSTITLYPNLLLT